MATDSFANPVDFQDSVTFRQAPTFSANSYPNSNAAAVYPLPFENWREATAFNVVLPSAATSTHLGLLGGTAGSAGCLLISAGDCKVSSTTRLARISFQLPPEYVANGAVTIRASAGMQTTVSDTSCTIDFSAYKLSRTASAPSSDLVTTSATNIRSLTMADKSFTVTPTTLSAGDWLDIVMTIACVDAATGTSCEPIVGAVEVLCSIRG